MVERGLSLGRVRFAAGSARARIVTTAATGINTGINTESGTPPVSAEAATGGVGERTSSAATVVVGVGGYFLPGAAAGAAGAG